MEKGKVIRIVATVVLLAGAVFVEHFFDLPVWELLCIYLVPFLVAGYDVIAEALDGLVRGKIFNEDFLMCVATVGALCIGFLPSADTEFAEAVCVMLFFQIGELFEDYAGEKSRRSIKELMDIRPETAHLLQGNGQTDVSPEVISVGERIVVLPGEKIPLDGIVERGVSSLNTVALTGESIPRDVSSGSEVLSGCINLSGMIVIKVTRSFRESAVSKIIELVEHANACKSKSETFITRFARIYTPFVVMAAVVLAFVPPLLSECFSSSFSLWLGRALTFLVVSCPCALVISVPLTFFCGIGCASHCGILIKGARFMETLSHLSIIVFDKTGTLTKGTFEVNAIHPNHISKEELLHLAAHAERHSTHPIALSLKNAFPNENDGCSVENVEELAGRGIRANVNGNIVCVGNSGMMDTERIGCDPCHEAGTIVHVSVNDIYAGHIIISDNLRGEAKEAIHTLRKLGADRVVMLTGDRKEVGERISEELGLDECYAELLPADKVTIVERLASPKNPKRSLVFVGDGINDAPVLTHADIGIAMGGVGSDAAIEAADVVLVDDNLMKIAQAVSISRKSMRIATQNICFTIFVKLLVLALAGMGAVSMWMAVFADVGVTVLAVLNAMRALREVYD